MEISENVCKENFEEYAQATWKKNGKPTIIRLQTHTGNMNPDMGKVDIVPDDDLNKNLKFHVSNFWTGFPQAGFYHIEIEFKLNINACFDLFQQRNMVEVVRQNYGENSLTQLYFCCKAHYSKLNFNITSLLYIKSFAKQ